VRAKGRLSRLPGRFPFLWLAALCSSCLLAATFSAVSPRGAPVPTRTVTHHSTIEAAPVCPWREPKRDLRTFFPGATGVHEERRILSHLRLTLIRELGRPLSPGEMLLRPFHVVQGSRAVGTVLLRRVKGEFGAIELVLAVAADGQVRGVRIQREREPERIAAALTDPHWLASFRGKTADSSLRPGEDLLPVPEEARVSATAVAEGVRSLLILLRAGAGGGTAA
jgi:hypothetical protein